MFLYVDATSGGMILQVLLSGVVGGAVVFKLMWRNVLNTVLRRKEDETPENTAQAATDEHATPNA